MLAVEERRLRTSQEMREYFAAVALQGLCAAGGGEAKHLARRAVQLADALIAELEK